MGIMCYTIYKEVDDWGGKHPFRDEKTVKNEERTMETYRIYVLPNCGGHPLLTPHVIHGEDLSDAITRTGDFLLGGKNRGGFERMIKDGAKEKAVIQIVERKPPRFSNTESVLVEFDDGKILEIEGIKED